MTAPDDAAAAPDDAAAAPDNAATGPDNAGAGRATEAPPPGRRRSSPREAFLGWFHGRFLGDVSTRLWAVLGGIAGTVGVVVTLLVYVLQADSGKSSPDGAGAPPNLRVLQSTVRETAEVAAKVDTHDGAAPTTVTVPGLTVDVTIENTGDYPAYISEASLVFRYHKQQRRCRQSAGPIEVSANYSVAVPVDARAVPFTLTRPMGFEVKPRSIDRLTVSVGPEKIGEEADWLYNFDVTLRYGDGHSVTAGPVSAVSPPDDVLADVNAAPVFLPDGPTCFMHNRDLIAALERLPGERTAGLTALRNRLNELLPADPAPATWTCAPTGPGTPLVNFTEACFRYSRWQLDVDLHTTLLPYPAVMWLDITPTGSPKRFTATFRTLPRGELQVGCLDVAPSNEDHSCAGQSTGNWTDRRITFSIVPQAYDAKTGSFDFNFATVDLAVTGRTYGDTLVDYATGPVRVARGRR